MPEPRAGSLLDDEGQVVMSESVNDTTDRNEPGRLIGAVFRFSRLRRPPTPLRAGSPSIRYIQRKG